jgi:23S rRNA (adenine(2030)-N(6))-methyltransferase RlmJ-like protein
LFSSSLTPEVRGLLSPYLDVLAAFNPGNRLVAYPGSPLIAKALMRRQDRLIACELEPTSAVSLLRHCGSHPRAKAIVIDGWTALTAFVPPKERRGMVLVDPPFESSADFTRLAARLAAAYSKWPTGIYLLWYPIKDVRETRRLARAMTRLGIQNPAFGIDRRPGVGTKPPVWQRFAGDQSTMDAGARFGSDDAGIEFADASHASRKRECRLDCVRKVNAEPPSPLSRRTSLVYFI